MRSSQVCAKIFAETLMVRPFGPPLYAPRFAGRAAVGGECPSSLRRATCYSARATGLRRPFVMKAARRIVVYGVRVCRQQSHLSGRAAAWVERSDRLSARSRMAALCMCSHSAIIRATVAAAIFTVSSIKTSSSRKWGQARPFAIWPPNCFGTNSLIEQRMIR